MDTDIISCPNCEKTMTGVTGQVYKSGFAEGRLVVRYTLEKVIPPSTGETKEAYKGIDATRKNKTLKEMEKQ